MNWLGLMFSLAMGTVGALVAWSAGQALLRNQPFAIATMLAGAFSTEWHPGRTGKALLAAAGVGFAALGGWGAVRSTHADADRLCEAATQRATVAVMEHAQLAGQASGAAAAPSANGVELWAEGGRVAEPTPAQQRVADVFTVFLRLSRDAELDDAAEAFARIRDDGSDSYAAASSAMSAATEVCR